MRIRTVLLALTGSLAITLLSVRVQQRGPEEVVFSNLCGPKADQLCYRPALKGGFPFGYLWDAPGISVENQLAFFEDYFHRGPFLADVAFWLAVILLVTAVWRKRVNTRGGNPGVAHDDAAR